MIPKLKARLASKPFAVGADWVITIRRPFWAIVLPESASMVHQNVSTDAELKSSENVMPSADEQTAASRKTERIPILIDLPLFILPSFPIPMRMPVEEYKKSQYLPYLNKWNYFSNGCR
jgi:hypothetical protein